MTMYKAYDPNGNPVIFESLTELRQTLDLTDDDIRKVFVGHVTTVSTGDQVITFYLR